jgi:hypothetical protein
MPQPPRQFEKSCQMYARLMEEIKRRQSVLAQILLNQTIPLPEMAAFEFCYLQLHKICEVFALGCLAAHGDIPEVRSKLLQKTYSADQIMKRLTEIHPEFYPVPSRQTVDQVTQRDFKKIALSNSRIVTLLNHHQIQTSQPNKQIWVLMQAEDGNARAS